MFANLDIPVATHIKVKALAQLLCTCASGSFVVYMLEDLAGDFQDDFLGISPTNEEKHEAARSARRKSTRSGSAKIWPCYAKMIP